MNTLDYLRLDLPTLGAICGAGWFFWMRYQALERRLDQIERHGLKQDAKYELSRQAVQASLERLEYLVETNKELIDKRSKRIEDAIGQLYQLVKP